MCPIMSPYHANGERRVGEKKILPAVSAHFMCNLCFANTRVEQRLQRDVESELSSVECVHASGVQRPRGMRKRRKNHVHIMYY
jgi:hypothetical protein